MRRSLLVVVLLAALTAATATGRARLERLGAGDVPAGLLYLPQGPYLRALALGHEQTLADLLYIWAIQYYSNYDDATRYDYLDQVFRGAITELDPLYAEPYLVGAMIMVLEARRLDLARQLYDKGLDNLPNNWEIAYWAGWDTYFAGDYLTARDYWIRADRMGDAPPWFGRLAARMLEKAGDMNAALEEYRRLARETRDEKTAKLARRWIERAQTQLAMEAVDQALQRYRQRNGACPRALALLVDQGFIDRLPGSDDTVPLHYDPASCSVLPAPGGTIQGAR